MDFVLGHTLRLFHPFLPFITEELWQGMGFANDLPAEQGGETIMFAPWPKPLDAEERDYFGLDETDERFANAKYEVVNLGRGLRRDFNIASNKRVRFVLRPMPPLPAARSRRAAPPAQRRAARRRRRRLRRARKARPPRSPRSANSSCRSKVSSTSPPSASASRKEIAKVEDELGKVRAKLADPNFAGKVPAKVLDEHRQRERDWAEKHAQLTKMCETFAG